MQIQFESGMLQLLLAMGFYFAYFISSWILLNRLKGSHYDEWENMGAPTIWWNNSPKNSLRVLRYLFSKDTQLDAYADLFRLKIVTATLLVLFLLFFVSVFFTVGH